MSQLVSNARGTLLAASTLRENSTNAGRGVLILPYGFLNLDQVLRAQGADLGAWRSLTNIQAMSSDGQWLAGRGAVVGGLAGSEETIRAFRARITLHAGGTPDLRFQPARPESCCDRVELRWSITDLLVTLESTPRMDPTIPWVREMGSPRIEGQEIVLELESVSENRHYRLRRLE
ncbi:MAG: hypothetical protein RIS76_841 [Verrucomicrobiota bacterium]|jgi:hypothetical protein